MSGGHSSEPEIAAAVDTLAEEVHRAVAETGRAKSPLPVATLHTVAREASRRHHPALLLQELTLTGDSAQQTECLENALTTVWAEGFNTGHRYAEHNRTLGAQAPARALLFDPEVAAAVDALAEEVHWTVPETGRAEGPLTQATLGTVARKASRRHRPAWLLLGLRFADPSELLGAFLSKIWSEAFNTGYLYADRGRASADRASDEGR